MFGNHAYFTNNPIIPITAEIRANTRVAQSRTILNRSLESGVRGMDNYCSSYYYSLEVKGDTIKIYPPEGQTTISLPREEMENLINDLREISQEENKCVSYRFPANALAGLNADIAEQQDGTPQGSHDDKP